MTENVVTSDSFEQYLISHPFVGKPENLYNSMNYIMQLGGKRMRPKFLLLSLKAVGGTLNEDAMKLALAIETFHNFSLVHDDIMDNAPIRRGKKTVHEEWNIPTAILAGDNLLLKCIELIIDTKFDNKIDLLQEFTTMASLVCDGQQMDMNLPGIEQISEADYLKMIELKTAVLPACALKMGAMAGGADKATAEAYYQFGLHLGMAFQLQDDYLDTFGSSADIGKQEGGDIIENKRTILYLHAESVLNETDKQNLKAWFEDPVANPEDKVAVVRELYLQAGSDTYLNQMKSDYEHKALEILNTICEPGDSKSQFMMLFDFLRSRNS